MNSPDYFVHNELTKFILFCLDSRDIFDLYFSSYYIVLVEIRALAIVYEVMVMQIKHLIG